jgi:hypothetical protein
MRIKSLVLGCFAAVLAAASAHAQGYYGQPYGYGPGPGYGGPGPGYGGPSYRRCLSSYGINDRLARSGWYPVALAGQSPDSAYLYMRVARGPEQRIAVVDGCSGRILQFQ